MENNTPKFKIKQKDVNDKTSWFIQFHDEKIISENNNMVLALSRPIYFKKEIELIFQILERNFS